jgi:hypothetical protein
VGRSRRIAGRAPPTPAYPRTVSDPLLGPVRRLLGLDGQTIVLADFILGEEFAYECPIAHANARARPESLIKLWFDPSPKLCLHSLSQHPLGML